MKKLPKTLYVRLEEDGDEYYALAYTTLQEAIEGDGPTLIGSYTLASSDKFEKVVKEVR